MKHKKIFVSIFTVLICSAFFFFVSVAYIELEVKRTDRTSAEKEGEPYVYKPTNSGLLFCFENGGACLIYLDFENDRIYGIFTERADITRIGKYTADYTVEADHLLIAGIIDLVGGIDLESDGELLRYTGNQVTELLQQKIDSYSFKKEIAEKIFEKISINGFSKDDFVYIIKNGGTHLLVPDCFYWEEHMKTMAENFEVIS